MMKVKDLIKMEIDVDVYDDVCEELGIAFCGPMELTESGKSKFESVLQYDVDLVNTAGPYVGIVGIVHIAGDDWEDKLKKAKEFFESMAGFCTADDYEKWFKD